MQLKPWNHERGGKGIKKGKTCAMKLESGRVLLPAQQRLLSMFTRYSTRGGQLAWVSSLCRQQSQEKEAARASPGTTLNNKLSINTPALTPQEAVPSLFSSAHMEKWLCLHLIGPRPWSSQHGCAHANSTHFLRTSPAGASSAPETSLCFVNVRTQTLAFCPLKARLEMV